MDTATVRFFTYAASRAKILGMPFQTWQAAYQRLYRGLKYKARQTPHWTVRISPGSLKGEISPGREIVELRLRFR
jgi:hypothetical protein